MQCNFSNDLLLVYRVNDSALSQKWSCKQINWFPNRIKCKLTEFQAQFKHSYWWMNWASMKWMRACVLHFCRIRWICFCYFWTFGKHLILAHKIKSISFSSFPGLISLKHMFSKVNSTFVNVTILLMSISL